MKALSIRQNCVTSEWLDSKIHNSQDGVNEDFLDFNIKSMTENANSIEKAAL